MSKQIKVKPIRVLTEEELQPKKLDLSDKKTAVHELKDYKDTDTSFFKDSAFGRTLSLRNKTGKTIAGVGLSVLGAFTGIKLDVIPQQIFEPMDLLQQILQTFANSQDWVIVGTSIVLFIIPLIIGLLVHKGYITKAIGKKITNVIKTVGDAKHPDSPGGTKVTAEERQEIIEEVLKSFGIEFKEDSK